MVVAYATCLVLIYPVKFTYNDTMNDI